MTINAQVLRFCERNMGSRVGRGECYDLADQALRGAGAKSAPDYGEISANADYVWGESVALAQARPGDIVQFRNFRVRVENADGWREETRGAPNHTAIIKEIHANGRVTFYEQNVGTGAAARRVQANTLNLVGGQHDGDTVVVHGGFHVYRPERAAAP